MMDKNKLKDLREETRELFQDKFGNIVFEEVPHRYTIDGVEYTPVSTIICGKEWLDTGGGLTLVEMDKQMRDNHGHKGA